MRVAPIALMFKFGSQAGMSVTSFVISRVGQLRFRGTSWQSWMRVQPLHKGIKLTPHHSESQGATPEKIQGLAEAGADVKERSKFGQTPLHWAAVRGTPENI